jgi:RNA polymerase sigma-70 factor (ECF subfamily)
MFDKNQITTLYRYCHVLTNHEANAYDLLQTALEKCLRHPPNELRAKMSYMRTIIRNKFIDQYRDAQKIELQEFDENIVTNIHDELSSFEDILISQESAKIIWALFDSSEREIMYLWAIQGLTTAEVAQFLDIPKGTIVSKISRLRKKVTSQLSTDIEYGAL